MNTQKWEKEFSLTDANRNFTKMTTAVNEYGSVIITNRGRAMYRLERADATTGRFKSLIRGRGLVVMGADMLPQGTGSSSDADGVPRSGKYNDARFYRFVLRRADIEGEYEITRVTADYDEGFVVYNFRRRVYPPSALTFVDSERMTRTTHVIIDQDPITDEIWDDRGICSIEDCVAKENLARARELTDVAKTILCDAVDDETIYLFYATAAYGSQPEETTTNRKEQDAVHNEAAKEKTKGRIKQKEESLRAGLDEIRNAGGFVVHKGAMKTQASSMGVRESRGRGTRRQENSDTHKEPKG
jgi:hypothetical protein